MSMLKIEKLLADYHAEVWEAAERGGQYDLAGVEIAEKLLAEIRALHQPVPTDEKAAHGAMLAAGFAVEYDERRGIHTYTGRIEHVTKLLNAQPMKLTAWATEDGRVAMDATDRPRSPGRNR